MFSLLLLSPSAWLAISGHADVSSLTIIWFYVFAAAVILSFVVGELTRNYSQTDKLWSLMPVIYGWITTGYYPHNSRLWIMAVLVTIWGIRLTYNFYRKGGYSLIPWQGKEDYRWSYLREKAVLKGRLRFGLFNLFFISFYQHFLILLFSSPFILVAGFGQNKISEWDLVIAVIMFLFIVLETIADNQQYRFQTCKRGVVEKECKFSYSLRKGFLSEGLWRYVRHPNYAAEQAFWICFYFFGVTATGQWLNPTLAGSILLLMLFQGSIWLTEKISSSKYPEYYNYKKNVSSLIPSLRVRKKNI